MERAARGKVEGLVGGPDPFESVQDAVRQGDLDEIMISTLPRRVSKWLRRVEGPGLPVTPIVRGAGKLSGDEERMRQAGAGVPSAW